MHQWIADERITAFHSPGPWIPDAPVVAESSQSNLMQGLEPSSPASSWGHHGDGGSSLDIAEHFVAGLGRISSRFRRPGSSKNRHRICGDLPADNQALIGLEGVSAKSGGTSAKTRKDKVSLAPRNHVVAKSLSIQELRTHVTHTALLFASVFCLPPKGPLIPSLKP